MPTALKGILNLIKPLLNLKSSLFFLLNYLAKLSSCFKYRKNTHIKKI